jgi:hypothetical protein
MGNFSALIINLIWEKATIIDPEYKDKFRQDSCGAWIEKDKYGKEDIYGWEINHVFPISKGGDDNIINLRAMHWLNHLSKKDFYPCYKCVIKAKKSKNFATEEIMIVNTKLQKQLSVKYNIRK